MSESGALSPSEKKAALPSASGGPPDARVSPEGLLEELDGSIIGTPGALSSAAVVAPAVAAISWRRGVLAATALTIARPRLWLLALVAFLARGGLAALALPIVVLPTFVGLANFVGPASVSAEGPGPRLVALVALGVATALALAVAGTLVAAAAEVALHRATVVAGGPLEPPSSAGRAVARVATLRLLLLVPLAAAAAAAVPAWIAVAYRELTLPSDVAAPLLARVLAGAPAASLAVLATWLAAEVVGGFAARRVVLLDASIPRALAGGILDPLRAPLGTALTVAAAVAATVLLLAPAWWSVGAAWDVARRVLAAGPEPLAALGVALLLAAAWLGVLALAGIAAALRATLVTMELLRRRR